MHICCLQNKHNAYIYMTGQCHAQLSECQPTDQSGEVLIPNIPDSYFTPAEAGTFRTSGTLATSSKATTYIFTIPAESAERNCSGDVVAIQYCYEARNNNFNDDILSFNILSMVRDGFNFTVISSLPVTTTPSSAICLDPDGPGGIQAICCDTHTLDPNTLALPSSIFTVGYMVVHRDVRPLQFTDMVAAYQVDRFQTDLTPSAGGRQLYAECWWSRCWANSSVEVSHSYRYEYMYTGHIARY